MTHTDFEPYEKTKAHLTKGYEYAGGKPDGEQSVREHGGRGYRVPNGALFSTVDDLARFVSWELGEGPPGILKKETQEGNHVSIQRTAR